MEGYEDSSSLHSMVGEHPAHDLLVTLTHLEGGELAELTDALEIISGYLQQMLNEGKQTGIAV